MDDLTEGILHVLCLSDFVVSPFPMKAQHRNSILVYDTGVDLTVAVVVRDHFSAARKAHNRSVEFPVVGLEGLSITADAVVPLDGTHDSERRRSTAPAAKLDMVAAR